MNPCTGDRFSIGDRVRSISAYHHGSVGTVKTDADVAGWYEVELDDMSAVEPLAIHRMWHSVPFNEDELEPV